MNELKPCPFCGGDAELCTAAGGYVVSCDTCDARTVARLRPEYAEQNWNRRTASLHVQEHAQEGEKKLWLWRNFVDGRPEYWAFDNPYPVHMDCGDPQTLGEPCGYAIFKPSRVGRAGVSEAEVLRRIALSAPVPADGGREPYAHLSDEDIQEVVTQAVRDGQLSWVGYNKDEDGRYVIPCLAPYHYQLARAIEQAVHMRSTLAAAPSVSLPVADCGPISETTKEQQHEGSTAQAPAVGVLAAGSDEGASRDGSPCEASQPAQGTPMYPDVICGVEEGEKVTLTIKQAQAVFEALDIGLGAATLEASQYHESMKGYRPHQHQALDDDAAKVSAALAIMGQLLEDRAAPKDSGAPHEEGGVVTGGEGQQ